MERAVSVSRQDRCPICGKSDWCRFLPANSEIPGARLVNCKRDTICQDQVSGVDGRTYVFIKPCRDNSSLYIDEAIREQERDKWRFERGIGRSGTKNRKAAATGKEISTGAEKALSVAGTAKILLDDQLDAIYRKFLSLLSLNRLHADYLQKENWSPELIDKSLVRSLPEQGRYRKQRKSAASGFDLTREAITSILVKEFGSVEGVPGFYERADGIWTFCGKKGLVIPLFNRHGQIYRLRIRVDNPERDENGKPKNRYLNFSSYREKEKEDGTYANYYSKGCQAGSQIGLYDLFTKDRYTAYITEGEKKSLMANHVLGQAVVSLPGVSTFRKLTEPDEKGISMLDYLVQKGVRIFVIAYDADKNVNIKVLECEAALVEMLREKGVQVAIAEWNPGFGKGLDDILGAGIRPNLRIVR